MLMTRRQLTDPFGSDDEDERFVVLLSSILKFILDWKLCANMPLNIYCLKQFYLYDWSVSNTVHCFFEQL